MQIIGKFVSDFGHIGFAEIGVILAVLIMDAALSGDNSIAINALAMDLPERMRNKTIWFGMVVAAFLRLVALGCAAFIMTNPWVQILGGVYLIKLCVDHFRKEEADAESGHKSRKSFVSVLIAIGFLDLSLSLDNVIAVVAMSQNLAVIVLGVLASIAMLAVATQVVRKVMGRYKSLEPAAYVILAFLGITMIADHGADFVIWTGEFLGTISTKIAGAHEIITKIHFKIGDVGEIVGVIAIIAMAIAMEEVGKHKQRKAHKHAQMHTHAHAHAQIHEQTETAKAVTE